MTAGGGALVPVEGFPFPVLASAGLEDRARAVGAGCVRAYDFLAEALAVEPGVTVLVLSAADWPSDGQPYGMPHFDGANLVLAGARGGFWQGFVPLLEGATPELLHSAREVYGADLDLVPFFDMLAVHELGHAFHQHQPPFPRHWLDELFANLCLHAYTAVVEPSRLMVLETFPLVLTSIDAEPFEHRDLEAFERLYPDVDLSKPRLDALNYGWYQCQLHRAAKRVYEAGGLPVLQRLQRLPQSLAAAADLVADGELAEVLGRTVHPEVAAVLVSWPG